VLHARTEDEEESIHHPHHPQLPSFAPASSRPFSQNYSRMYPYCSEKNNDIMPPVGEGGKKKKKR